MPSIRLTPADRNTLLAHSRRSADPAVRHRAHALLLLADGYTWATVAAVLYCSASTRSRWAGRFRADGVDAVRGRPVGRPRSTIHRWATLVVRWVLTFSPTDFRSARSRWSWEAAAVVLRDDFGARVGRETVRRWLHAAGLGWRRPRPVIRPKDPAREEKLRALRALLHHLPDDQTAVFMDEVDVNLNPKVGSMWMIRGIQEAVETPGTNDKRYVAGSIHWPTGRVILTEGKPREGRSAALFLRHRDDRRRAFRHDKVIHVLCDNAGTHTPEGSKLVRAYLAAWGHRVQLHYLPRYAPDTNPIERVWWRLHEAVTRNHRCKTRAELLDRTFDWFETRTHFRVRSKVYEPTPERSP
jgi:putative transposase